MHSNSELKNWYQKHPRKERGQIIDRLANVLKCQRITARSYLTGARPIQGHQIRKISSFTNGEISQEQLLTELEQLKE